MDQEAFIPTDVDVGEVPGGDERTVVAGPNAPDFLDLTGNEELVAAVRKYADTKYEQFKHDREERDDLEEKADYMWTCGVSDTLRAANETSDTRATTGSTLFYRQVRTLAAQTIGVAMSAKDPYRTRVLPNDLEPYNEAESEGLAEQRNALARYTRKVDRFWPKLIDAISSNAKLGTSFFMCRWNRVTAPRWIKDPVRDPETGEVTAHSFERREVVVADHPTWYQVPNRNFYADAACGADLQKHNCIVVTELVGIDDLWGGVKEGRYNREQVAKVNATHLYEGATAATGDDKREEQEKSRGYEDSVDDTRTGLFRLLHVWAKLPITEDGEWKQDAAVPSWHWFTFVQDIKDGPCICATDSYDPDGEFPGVAVNRNPDDIDSLYHVCDAAVLFGNFNEATTRKNQLYDNLETINKRPLKAVRGEVQVQDLGYGQHKILWVENLKSLEEMEVRDTSSTFLQTIQYTDDDSNRAVGTDRPIIGEALGGRTSATEADNIYKQAREPHLITTRYVLEQMLGWWGRKEQRYWETFGDPARKLQIVDGDEVVRVDLGQIYGDFDTEVTVVDDYEQSLTSNQNLSFILQSVVPNFMADIETGPFLAKVLQHFKWDPTGLIKTGGDADARRVVRDRIKRMLDTGEYEPPAPDENLKVHLRQAMGTLVRYRGVEDQYPFIELVRQYVEEVKFLMSEQQAQLAAPGPSAPGNETDGEVAGNQIAAARGAMAGVA